jgi:hypothetical protein
MLEIFLGGRTTDFVLCLDNPVYAAEVHIDIAYSPASNAFLPYVDRP